MGEIEVLGRLTPAYREILTPEALDFVENLALLATPRIDELLERRKAFSEAIDRG